MCLRWPIRIAVSLLLLLFPGGNLQAQEIELSPENTRITFETTHLGVLKVNGSFDAFSGTLVQDGESWVITGAIESSSINTNNQNRDETLRSDAYFDVANYPEIRFEGRGEKTSDGLAIYGVLFLKNLRAELSFRFIEAEEGLMSAELKLSRKEIGFTFDSMDMLIGDEVIITLTIDESI